MDLFWVKTLAKSKLKDGQWFLDNPDEVQKHNKRAISKKVSSIYQDLLMSVAAFNEHTQDDRQLNLCPMDKDADGLLQGFVILAENIQLKVERSGTKLMAILEFTESFQLRRRVLHQFEARLDALGGIRWCMDNKLFVTDDMIIKQLLHDIWSAVLEK
ncbi:MAG: hypothetical protein HRU19_06190 [Pseudobacteriovorax sp.]|nr:hypothetical protein [Pseudobacteriovorax sp.]